MTFSLNNVSPKKMFRMSNLTDLYSVDYICINCNAFLRVLVDIYVQLHGILIY